MNSSSKDRALGGHRTDSNISGVETYLEEKNKAEQNKTNKTFHTPTGAAHRTPQDHTMGVNSVCVYTLVRIIQPTGDITKTVGVHCFFFSPHLLGDIAPRARGRFKVGEHTLELFLMCDSYVGCDQEYAVELMVGAPGSDDESDED